MCGINIVPASNVYSHVIKFSSTSSFIGNFIFRFFIIIVVYYSSLCIFMVHIRFFYRSMCTLIDSHLIFLICIEYYIISLCDITMCYIRFIYSFDDVAILFSFYFDFTDHSLRHYISFNFNNPLI